MVLSGIAAIGKSSVTPGLGLDVMGPIRCTGLIVSGTAQLNLGVSRFHMNLQYLTQTSQTVNNPNIIPWSAGPIYVSTTPPYNPGYCPQARWTLAYPSVLSQTQSIVLADGHVCTALSYGQTTYEIDSASGRFYGHIVPFTGLYQVNYSVTFGAPSGDGSSGCQGCFITQVSVNRWKNAAVNSFTPLIAIQTQTGHTSYPIWPCATSTASVVQFLNAGDALILECYIGGRPDGAGGGQVSATQTIPIIATSAGSYYTSGGGTPYVQGLGAGTNLSITLIS